MKKLVFSTIFAIALACGLTAQAQETALPSSFAEALNADAQPIQLVSHAHHAACEPCGHTCESRPSGIWSAGVEMPLLSLYANHGAGGSPGRWFDDFDTQAALRLTAGYQGANGLGLRGRFFTYESDGAAANEYFDVELYDLEATSALKLRQWNLLAFGGMRFGSIEFSDEQGSGDHRLDGVGFTLGGEARRSIGRRLNLVAGVRHSVLYGEMERVSGAASVLDNSLVPITEFRLGVEYAVTLGSGNRLIAGVGYEHQQYSSLSVSPNSIDPEDVDVALAGPVFSLTLLH